MSFRASAAFHCLNKPFMIFDQKYSTQLQYAQTVYWHDIKGVRLDSGVRARIDWDVTALFTDYTADRANAIRDKYSYFAKKHTTTNQLVITCLLLLFLSGGIRLSHEMLLNIHNMHIMNATTCFYAH